MLRVCVRWTLLLAVAFLGLAPSQQAEGGEFLKRLFGRKCRKVCSPCDVKSVPFVCRDIKNVPSICPVELIAKVEFYKDAKWNCAYEIFRGSNCANQLFHIHVPCNTNVKSCKDGACCDGENCASQTVLGLEELKAVSVELGTGMPDFDPNVVNGASATYISGYLSSGFESPIGGESGVSVRCSVVASGQNYEVYNDVYKYHDGARGKYYLLHRLTLKSKAFSDIQLNYGIGYEVPETQYTNSNASEATILGKGTVGMGGKAYQFAEGDSNTGKWAWNYNVVEFK